MDSNKRVHKQTTNKQACMHGHLKQNSNYLISQNLHKQIHANQAPATSFVKDINK